VWRLALLAVALAAFLSFAAPASPAIQVRIGVVNASSYVSGGALADSIPYLQKYISQVCGYYHCSAKLYVRDSEPASPKDWTITISDDSSDPGALGYHDTNMLGDPEAFVAARYSEDNNVPWTTVFSHELGEMLVDPCGCAVADTSPNQFMAEFTMFEIADPVQQHWYMLGPVQVSDFVLPHWFIRGTSGPFDLMRALSSPLEVNNGWKAYWRGGSWHTQEKFTSARGYAGSD